uniref:Putative RNase_H superfamily protein n=1 Tax=viral metagenome TaxID=1070528 RepID=A0A6H1ZC68_9ZZZZ
MKLLAFDLEIARPFVDSEWRNKDLGISCIGLASVDGDKRDAWTMTDDAARHGDHAMKREGLDISLGTLVNYAQLGYKIISWNGLGFDFPMIYEYVEQKQLCKALALAHYDLAFQMFCAKGYMIGLDTAAKGMGLTGKLEGMHGDMAPPMWAGTDDVKLAEGIEERFGVKAGSIEAQNMVLKYVQQDAVTTLEVIEEANARGSVSWLSRNGRRNCWYLPISDKTWALRDVAWCLQEPAPDTSWMSEPRTRDEYAGWLA